MSHPQKLSGNVPNNLPIRLATFIGRKFEIAQITEWLAGTPPATRLLTLTGVGGAGKTRLALEVAPLLLNDFPQGVWLIKLASLSDPQLVVQTIAQTLGLKDEPARSPLDNLNDYLQTSQLLLILDNCEHLISACAEVAENLLQSCSKLAILATSREGLNIEGEVCLPVPPLTFPGSEATTSLAEIGQTEAVQLFFAKRACRSA